MSCTINKVDSNITGLSIAEETCLKQLPGTLGVNAVWEEQEPNSYNDFGGEITTVARSPINVSRQRRKGTVTDLDASGGYNQDYTPRNSLRVMQGFFFADIREAAGTKPMNGAAIVAGAVTASSKTYALASGGAAFVAGRLVHAFGYGNAANNGLKTVASSTGTTVVVVETLVDEASPPAAAGLRECGVKGASADIAMTVVSGLPVLTSVALNFTTLPLFPGKWVYLGDDTAGNRFVNNVGYARIKTITATAITFDDTTWTPVAEAGTGKTIAFYYGHSLKNENTASLIKRRSWNLERQLGTGPYAATQAEYLEGAVPNEFTLNIPSADKVNADFSFVACDNTIRTGNTGDLIKAGTRVAAPGEVAFNTTSDVIRMKLAILNPANSNPTPLFGYVTEGTITIQNGITPNKAVGVLGAFDVSSGDFVAGGSVTAYFTSVEAVRAVRNNSDVSFNAIFANSQRAVIFDTPLLGLGGGRITVEKDQPIMVPLESNGAQNANGYTMLCDTFLYLPLLAMPK